MRKRKDVLHELEQERNRLSGLMNDKEKTEEARACAEKVRELTDELNMIVISEEAERSAASAVAESHEMRDISRRFSFAKFIREAAGGDLSTLTGIEKEVAEMGAEEAKRKGISLRGVSVPFSVLNNRAFVGQTAGTDADGGYTIESELRYQEELRKKLVLSAAGATYLGGLSGNIDLVQGSAVTAGWVDENEEGEDSKKTFTSVSVGPKRCWVNVPISRLLTIQSSIDVERVIISDMMNAHAELVENAAINGDGEKGPTGILNTSGISSVSLGENGAVPTFKNIVDLETQISLKNADVNNMSYLTNAKVRGLMKTTLKSQNVPGYIWENDQMNGYRAVSSNLIPSNLTKGTSKTCSAIVFGNFSDLWIMQWGGLDLVVDPYSLKKMGAYEVCVNAYHNVFLKRKESFAAIKDALTE